VSDRGSARSELVQGGDEISGDRGFRSPRQSRRRFVLRSAQRAFLIAAVEMPVVTGLCSSGREPRRLGVQGGVQRLTSALRIASVIGFARVFALIVLLVLLATAAPADATLLVQSRNDENGLVVRQLTGPPVSTKVEIAGSSAGYRVTNLDTIFDLIPFDRREGCSPIAGDGRAVFCQRFNSTISLVGAQASDSWELGGITIASEVRAFAGGGLVNNLFGQPGPDTLESGVGGDRLDGRGGADTLLGNAGVDVLTGGTNADVGRGGGDGDVLSGDSGNDDLDGGDGDDSVRGGTFDDRLVGGAGADTIDGGSGLDVISGGTGEDVITAKDPDGSEAKADFVNCGADFDSVFTDRKDIIKPIDSCEEVEESPVGETPHVKLPRRSLNVNSAGLAVARLTCPRRTTIGCRGRLSLRLVKRGARRPARTRYRIRAGRSARVRVRLTGREARRVRGRVRGVLKSVERGRIGPKTTITRPRLR
jgi:hypothetical protein